MKYSTKMEHVIFSSWMYPPSTAHLQVTIAPLNIYCIAHAWLLVIAANASIDVSPRFLNWNTSLHDMISKFAANHADITAFTFSSWDLFTRILDDPVTHGFPKGDVQKFGGSIWVDHVHPSSKIHDFIAKGFSDFLNSCPAFVEP
jgi:hypothetical protein